MIERILEKARRLSPEAFLAALKRSGWEDEGDVSALGPVKVELSAWGLSVGIHAQAGGIDEFEGAKELGPAHVMVLEDGREIPIGRSGHTRSVWLNGEHVGTLLETAGDSFLSVASKDGWYRVHRVGYTRERLFSEWLRYEGVKLPENFKVEFLPLFSLGDWANG